MTYLGAMPVHTEHHSSGRNQTTTKTVTLDGQEHTFEGPPEGPFAYQGEGDPDPDVLAELLTELDPDDVDHEIPSPTTSTTSTPQVESALEEADKSAEEIADELREDLTEDGAVDEEE